MNLPAAFLELASRQFAEIAQERSNETVRVTFTRVQKGRENVTLESEIHVVNGQQIGSAKTHLYRRIPVENGLTGETIPR